MSVYFLGLKWTVRKNRPNSRYCIA